jgi:hypothetical protein
VQNIGLLVVVVFRKSYIYCLSVHSFFLVSFTSMYTTLKIISRKFLGVSLIWTLFSHVGAILYEKALNGSGRNEYRYRGPSIDACDRLWVRTAVLSNKRI